MNSLHNSRTHWQYSAGSRQWLHGSPQIWAGRCWALMMLTYGEVQQLTHWDLLDSKKDCPSTGDQMPLACAWRGLPPDNRVYAFYAAGAIIAFSIGLFFYFRRQIDINDLRSMQLIGLALLQVLIAVGMVFIPDMLVLPYPQPFRSVVADIVFWLFVSGFARFLLLLRNPMKVRR